MTTVEVLRKARELVAKGWTRAGAAVRSDGGDTTYDSPAAVRFCMVGACWRAGMGTNRGEAAVTVLAKLLGTWPSNFNDAPERTKGQVLAAFDRAIAAAEASS